MMRQFLRLGGPTVAAVVLIGGCILAVSLYSYDRNRDDALLLANDLMTAIERGASLEVQHFLSDSAVAAKIASAASADPLSREGREQFERVAIELIRAKPQLAMVYVGNPDGDYLLIRRAESGGFETEHIENRPSGREIRWVYRKPDGAVDRSETVAETGFDPRTRPWYRLAVAADGVAWSDAYVFFTDGKPGITASLAMRDGGGRTRAVIGADLHLDRLSTFLRGLKIGNTGRAMIVDDQQLLIAFSGDAAVARRDGTTLRRTQIDELGDPVLAQVRDRLQAKAPLRASIDIGRTRFIVMSSSLQELVGRAWSVVLVVPEDDFIGFVAVNNRKSIGLFLVVLCLTVLLTALLVGRGVAADRLARAADHRRRATDAQHIALEVLGRIAPTFDPTDEAARRRLTEIVAQGAQAHRVTLWRLDATCMTCLDAYAPSTRAHTAGTQLPYADCPHLCDAMRRGEEITARDTTADVRLAKFFVSYFKPGGTRSLLAIPIGTGRAPVAYLWIEYHAAGPVAHTGYAFARAVAQMIAPRFLAAGPAAQTADDVPHATAGNL